jgi:predicted dehydrogenase
MKFLIVGLGSMGKRRIRCLKRLGFSEIVGYDPQESRRAEARSKYGIEVAADWVEASAMPVDAWIVSTPPDTHVSYGLQAIDRKTAFFTEANVTDPMVGTLIRRLRETRIVGAPSCTMRYYFGPRRIKQLISEEKIGRPLAFTYQSGQYLPDWHPWESYKDFYVSKRETGACREIVPFELCWLVDVFGPVATLSCMKDKVSDLDADIDDIYQLLLNFEHRLVGHLMVDVIARPAVRIFRVMGTAGTLEWDHGAQKIRRYDAERQSWTEESLDSGTVEPGYVHAEEPYVAETADFVAAIRKERLWPYSYEEDERILDLLVRAEASSKSGRHC